MNNKVFICIPIHNRIKLTLECLKSIFLQTYENFHVVISDSGSTDNSSAQILKYYPEKVTVLTINESNFWTGGINACLRYVVNIADKNDFILTINNDIELASDCIEKSINYAIKNPRHIVGSLNLFYHDRTRIEPSASIEKKILFFYYFKRVFNFGQKISHDLKEHYFVDILSGKGVLYPSIIFLHGRLFKEELLPHYHADGEFIITLKKEGFSPVLLTSSQLYSHVYETGIGTLSKNPIDFFKSFSSLKSANHIMSLINFSKSVYGKKWILCFLPKLLFILLGYLKRLFKKDYYL